MEKYVQLEVKRALWASWLPYSTAFIFVFATSKPQETIGPWLLVPAAAVTSSKASITASTCGKCDSKRVFCRPWWVLELVHFCWKVMIFVCFLEFFHHYHQDYHHYYYNYHCKLATLSQRQKPMLPCGRYFSMCPAGRQSLQFYTELIYQVVILSLDTLQSPLSSSVLFFCHKRKTLF